MKFLEVGRCYILIQYYPQISKRCLKIVSYVFLLTYTDLILYDVQ